MAELRNEFTWSFTRRQTFQACRRRYWFRYYAFWNGWSRDAPELARRAYFFSKMGSVRMLLGSAVHETIADLLRALKSGREAKSPFEQVRLRMNEAWRNSKEERWRAVGPKQAPPLFEHYYGVAIPAEEITRLREQAQRCVRGFLESDVYRSIVKAGAASFRSIDALEVAELGGVACYVAPDFAYDDGGTTWLLDWKTGSERDDHELQLLAYAEFARQKWSLAPEKLRAADVMLDDGRTLEVRIDAGRLAGAAETIRASAAAMREALADPAANVARREALPPTTDARECRRCFFREICDERPADAEPLAAAAT
jgi:CRISPR/Cas system-associated exonuclease Cas4 (RecB family)